MSEAYENRPRGFLSRTSDRVALIVLGALMIVSLVLTALNRWAGVTLIRGELYVLLPVGVLLVALAWGMYAIVRRFRRRAMRVAVGAVMGFLLLSAVMLAMSYGTLYVNLTIPQRYAEVASPDGSRRLVVMRLLDSDQERVEQRHAARLEADPDSDPEITADDWGYIYTAYDKMLHFFYRSGTSLEGEVIIGYASEGQLMVDWQDDGSARFFVKDPAPVDGGEMLVK